MKPEDRKTKRVATKGKKKRASGLRVTTSETDVWKIIEEEKEDVSIAEPVGCRFLTCLFFFLRSNNLRKIEKSLKKLIPGKNSITPISSALKDAMVRSCRDVSSFQY